MIGRWCSFFTAQRGRLKMQQAISSTDHRGTTVGSSLSPKPVAPPRFVVNLCASTTPVGLVHPTHAGLKRFTFFVSRRLEEGRERFRLHMGYFDSAGRGRENPRPGARCVSGGLGRRGPGHQIARARGPPRTGEDRGTAGRAGRDGAAPPLRLPNLRWPLPHRRPKNRRPSPAVTGPTAAAPAESDAWPRSNSNSPRTSRAQNRRPRVPPGNAAHDVTSSLSDVRATIASLSDTAETKIPAAPAGPRGRGDTAPAHFRAPRAGRAAGPHAARPQA